MEADELAGLLREMVDDQVKGWPYDRNSDPTFAGGAVASGNEDTGFFIEMSSGERFLVSVAKVGE